MTASWAALAQPSSNQVAAEALFREGRALLEQHEYREACEKLRKSQQLEPAVGTLLVLGRCYDLQARAASAWFTYREAVALAARLGDARQPIAQNRADALEPRLARLQIHVDPKDAGIVVSVDGQPVAREVLDTQLPVDPGVHRVEASLDLRWGRDVEVPDNGVNVTVDVPSLVRPPPAPGPPAWRRPLSIGMIGAGTITAGAGVIFGLQAIVKVRDVNAACPASTCTNQGALQENGTARTDADVSTVLIPVGLVLAAAGGVIFAMTGTTVEATASPREARVGFRWGW
jgi:hypothetical protein